MNQQPLSSTPIRELRDNTLQSEYFLRVEAYLKKHQCTCGYMSDGSYLVLFPPGTVEEVYPNARILYSCTSLIRLPDGTVLRKRAHEPQREGQKRLVGLLFPKNVYEER